MLKKILKLLSFEEKKKAFILALLTLIAACFDVLGISFIFPFITVLANPKIVETNLELSYLYQQSIILGINSIDKFIFLLGTLAFLLLIISLFLRGFALHTQVRFSYMLEAKIGQRLIEIYLHQPYVWFLSRNSSVIIRNILSEIGTVINQAVMPIINIISQGVLVLLLLILLIIVSPMLAFISMLIFSVSYAVVFYFLKNILNRIGPERLKQNEARYKLVSETFGAIKEIKATGLEQVFSTRFSKPAKIFAESLSSSQIINLLPRYFIEGIAIGSMIILSISLLMGENNFVNVVPTIALYAFAAYRLIPALQQIYSSISQLRFSEPALNNLNRELMNINTPSVVQIPNNTSIINLNKFIQLKNVYFSYPNAKQPALKNINISIPSFSKTGIIGVTGSGKTTLVDLILGLLEPSQGNLSVDGNIITSANRNCWKKIIGYVPQQIYLTDSSIAENIAFGEQFKNININEVEKAAKVANLHDFITKELPEKYDTIVGERGIKLSGGQRQRIGIARALYHQPQLLIFDEATSALDNLTEQAVMKSIDYLSDKITIIIISHRLSTVKNCDNVFLLNNGQLKLEEKLKTSIKKDL
jgi:ABC-type multidrug transport system fused ATPase/permease subunit